ncbi:MAG: aminoglycoside 2-N-acetyltransferase [Amycolatopsis sp.]|uniref:GNAT family N-acetyltransferase n=1 Tax=Amycolatopsis sp. TaxID=37632 RepID=UPI002609079A|nr:GNAT family N-acetyltransferase [Amycolatopsis sp.]MCU1681026.1 aminoglycoside 2-N-acetyltransferase [Amycolatopsis sp.]
MIELATAFTAELDAATRSAARTLLYDVFEDMTEHDWDHALGGMHVVMREDGELVGHASVVQRQLLHGGRALRTGYVEAVAVRADRRGRGHGDTLMAEVERLIRGAYDLGALGASDLAATFYPKRGWLHWQGPTSALTPDGIQRTEAEDGSVFVLPLSIPLDLSGALICDWRAGDVW